VTKESQDFERQIRLFHKRLTLAAVFGLDQRFQQVVKGSFNAFAQHKSVITREFAGMVTRPQDEIVGFGDDDQFYLIFATRHVRLFPLRIISDPQFSLRLPFGGGW
jgi:hypothetical protein